MIDGTTGFLSRISREIHDVCQTDRQKEREYGKGGYGPVQTSQPLLMFDATSRRRQQDPKSKPPEIFVPIPRFHYHQSNHSTSTLFYFFSKKGKRV